MPQLKHPENKNNKNKKWSARVSRESDALDLEEHVFKKAPKDIARSLKRSAEKSTRRKGTVYQSAMSMLNFYINRAGKNLTPSNRKRLDEAKEELRSLFDRPSSLETYKAKRNFKKTSEPAGERRSVGTSQSEPLFVVQRHEASRLHYDFRLELDGVLKSWAVPKEPTMDPRIRRLAVHVEDHPLEYASFHGDIPEGEYGAGHVDIWDNGWWVSTDPDPMKAYENGKLNFELKGQKLKGHWTLVRTQGLGGKTKQAKQEKNWLLIKNKEKGAQPLPNSEPVQPIMRDKIPRKAKAKKLTHSERVIFPENGITKGDLAAYFEMVGDLMLPFVEGRPLALIRCPGGLEEGCFFQQRSKTISLGEGITSVSVDEGGPSASRLQLESPEGLKTLVQHGAIELHVWGARGRDVEHPDQLVFDLDPDPAMPWTRVVEGARSLVQILESKRLVPFLKLTGGKGLHIHVPITPRYSWEETHEYAIEVAREIEAKHPQIFTTASLKKERTGRIYIDYVRNSRGVTFIAPYSPRAKPEAPVAAPIFADELSPRIKPNHFTVKNLKRRLAKQKTDPWSNFFASASALDLEVRN